MSNNIEMIDFYRIVIRVPIEIYKKYNGFTYENDLLPYKLDKQNFFSLVNDYPIFAIITPVEEETLDRVRYPSKLIFPDLTKPGFPILYAFIDYNTHYIYKEIEQSAIIMFNEYSELSTGFEIKQIYTLILDFIKLMEKSKAVGIVSGFIN
jgi:hypothetical protein